MIKNIFFCVSVRLHIVNIFIICFKIKVKKKNLTVFSICFSFLIRLCVNFVVFYRVVSEELSLKESDADDIINAYHFAFFSELLPFIEILGTVMPMT